MRQRLCARRARTETVCEECLRRTAQGVALRHWLEAVAGGIHRLLGGVALRHLALAVQLRHSSRSSITHVAVL
jgi:hypothetical protein